MNALSRVWESNLGSSFCRFIGHFDPVSLRYDMMSSSTYTGCSRCHMNIEDLYYGRDANMVLKKATCRRLVYDIVCLSLWILLFLYLGYKSKGWF